jgi:HSP90 family molecular chaperone
MSFKFEISLSILNHLGRNLYRNFITVIGEAISNSWDAYAHNVWIDINKENGTMYIVDDGTGMTEDDFQNKFLKIGYSKRVDNSSSSHNRPYIGRKDIGKLALLSCASRVHISSKSIG